MPGRLEVRWLLELLWSLGPGEVAEAPSELERTQGEALEQHVHEVVQLSSPIERKSNPTVVCHRRVDHLDDLRDYRLLAQIRNGRAAANFLRGLPPL